MAHIFENDDQGPIWVKWSYNEDERYLLIKFLSEKVQKLENFFFENFQLFQTNFQKKNKKKLWCVEKNILFCKIFENYFSENEILENWSMAVGIWLFLRHLQRPITRVCLTQMKHFIPLNDSTHQDLWREINSD